jgi:hypothetical protein
VLLLTRSGLIVCRIKEALPREEVVEKQWEAYCCNRDYDSKRAAGIRRSSILGKYCQPSKHNRPCMAAVQQSDSVRLFCASASGCCSLVDDG